jgi:plastocyanin
MNRVRIGAAVTLAVAGLVAVAFGLGAFRPSGSPPVPSAPQVHLACRDGDPDRPCVFLPGDILIRPGTTVRWTNDEDVFHTVTSTDSLQVLQPNGLFDHTMSRTGESFEFGFPNSGTFHYYCQVHAEFMTGTIVVQR